MNSSKKESIFACNLSVKGMTFSVGTIDLSCNYDGVIVSENLSIKDGCFFSGDIYVNDTLIISGGKVSGNIFAKKVKIFKCAEVNGNATYGTASIEDGAKFSGEWNVADAKTIESTISQMKSKFFPDEQKNQSKNESNSKNKSV